MRILLFSLHFVEYPVELAKSLSKYDEVHIILARRKVDNTLGDGLKNALGEKVSYTLLNNYSLKNPKSLINLFIISRKILSFKPQVIHHQESLTLTNLFLLFYSLFIPTIGTLHDINPHPGSRHGSFFFLINIMRNFIIRFLYKKIIVHGQVLKEELVGRVGVEPDSVAVIPHGALFSFKEADCKERKKEEPYTVLFFGRILEYKGLKYLIEAEPIISEKLPSFRVIIAGAGNDLDLYRDQLEANPHFEIHDYYIPNDQVADFFNRSSIIVLPYIEASQSGVIAMSYAFGKPVVVTDVGSLTEIVKHGLNGIVVPPKDPVSLASAIIKVLEDNELKKALGQKAFDFANSVLSWDNIAQMTRNKYRLLLS